MVRKHPKLLWQLTLAGVLALGAGLIEFSLAVIATSLVGQVEISDEYPHRRQLVGYTDRGQPVFAGVAPGTAEDRLKRRGAGAASRPKARGRR